MAGHPLVEELLQKRGIENRDVFLSPVYEDRPDPFLMKGMETAVVRILDGISRGEKIAVWSDYDCDGVPGGALMRDFFTRINYPLVSYIAERSEGYGLNNGGIAKLADEGVSLIVTVDCGITALEEVEYARSRGVEVIITDHHLPRTENGVEMLPNALAVLNPHQSACAYPFKELCGTGVAFKLVEGLITKNMEMACSYFSWEKGREKWLLDVVALATVADMVSLTGENRTLVHFGLVVLKKGRRPGLRALCDAMRVPLAHLTEDDISFSIAPKINAASRMKSPHLALELLTTADPERAKILAKELVRLNDARKLEGARVAKEVKHRLESGVTSDVIVLGHVDWKPALLGIAATTLVETYQKTVCLWGKDGELIKGSCRSNGTVNIVSLMTEAKDVFLEFGGHELSGGFSVRQDALHTLAPILNETYARVKTDGAVETGMKKTDAVRISVAECSPSLYAGLRTLAPFGVGNEKPLFLFEGVSVARVMRFGSHQEHVRLTIEDERGDTIDAVSFFVSRTPFKHLVELISNGDRVTLTGSFEQSFFGNRRELRLRLESLALQ